MSETPLTPEDNKQPRSPIRRLLTTLGLAGATAGATVALAAQAGTDAQPMEKPVPVAADPAPGAETATHPTDPVQIEVPTTDTIPEESPTEELPPETVPTTEAVVSEGSTMSETIDPPDGSSGAMTIERPPLPPDQSPSGDPDLPVAG